jgi:hypothetical protein
VIVIVHALPAPFFRLTFFVIPIEPFAALYAPLIVPFTVNVASEVVFVLIPTPCKELIRN